MAGPVTSVVVFFSWGFFFFFQAEDGIRDKLVIGVQTCALPIWNYTAGLSGRAARSSNFLRGHTETGGRSSQSTSETGKSIIIQFNGMKSRGYRKEHIRPFSDSRSQSPRMIRLGSGQPSPWGIVVYSRSGAAPW